MTDLDRRILGDPFSGQGRMLGMETVDTCLPRRGRAGTPMDDPGEVLNSRGYRSPEVAPEKRPGVRRIAVLGDSCTFGVISMGGLRMETPRPCAAVLQEILDRNFGGGRFEVINDGMIGYTAWHGLRTLRREVLPDDPDFVVIRFGWNDGLGSLSGRSLPSPRCPWKERLADLGAHSRLVALLSSRGAPVVRPGDALPTASDHRVPSVTPADRAWNLSPMIDLARSHGSKRIPIDAPASPVSPEIRASTGFIRYTRYRTLEEYLAAHERYGEIGARVALEKRVPLVATDLGPGDFSPFDIARPNASGHARTARRLFAEIASEAARDGVR